MTKKAFILTAEIERLIERYGPRVGFLTLTFPDSPCVEEGEKRFASLRKHFLIERFAPGCWVRELHKSGVPHYHGCVVCVADIATGSDVALIRLTRGRRGANEFLREEWAWLRSASSRYRFGRHRLEPVEEPSRAAAYLCKYLDKDPSGRVRYVGYLSGHCKPPPPPDSGLPPPPFREVRAAGWRLAWCEGGRKWRAEMALVAAEMPAEVFKAKMGRYWAGHVRKRSQIRHALEWDKSVRDAILEVTGKLPTWGPSRASSGRWALHRTD